MEIGGGYCHVGQEKRGRGKIDQGRLEVGWLLKRSCRGQWVQWEEEKDDEAVAVSVAQGRGGDGGGCTGARED